MELNEELKSTKTDLKSIEDKYVAEISVCSSEELCNLFLYSFSSGVLTYHKAGFPLGGIFRAQRKA